MRSGSEGRKARGITAYENFHRLRNDERNIVLAINTETVSNTELRYCINYLKRKVSEQNRLVCCSSECILILLVVVPMHGCTQSTFNHFLGFPSSTKTEPWGLLCCRSVYQSRPFFSGTTKGIKVKSLRKIKFCELIMP